MLTRFIVGKCSDVIGLLVSPTGKYTRRDYAEDDEPACRTAIIQPQISALNDKCLYDRIGRRSLRIFCHRLAFSAALRSLSLATNLSSSFTPFISCYNTFIISLGSFGSFPCREEVVMPVY
jgi:hypothetical protein